MNLKRVLVLLLLAGLLQTGANAASPAPTGEPYVIPVILPLTSTAAFLGHDEQEAMTVYERLINSTGGIHGRPLRFEFRDDQSNPSIAVQITRDLMTKNPAAIIGSSISAACGAMTPLVQANGPVQYCLSPGLNAKPLGYTFVSSVALDYLEPAVIRFAREMGYKRIGIIALTDASGQESIRAIEQTLRSSEFKDVQIVDTERFAPSDINVTAQIANLKAASPQVILAAVTGTAFGTVLRTIKDSGIKVPVITSGANANRAQLMEYSAFVPDKLYFNGFRFMDRNRIGPGPLRVAIDEMYDAFKAAGLQTSSAGSSFAWDPAKIVVDSLRKLEPSANAKDLRDYIGSHQFTGINGIYDFRTGDQHGLTDQAVIVVRWQPENGTWVPASGPRGIPYRK